MHRNSLLSFTALFSFLGIADAWYLAEHALTNTALSCGVGALSGCNAVAQSSYSHFFGIPLGVYGVLFYAAIFVLVVTTFLVVSHRLDQILLVLGTLGMLASIYFVGLQLFVIKAICIYCFASFFLSVGIFVALFLLVVRKERKPALLV